MRILAVLGSQFFFYGKDCRNIFYCVDVVDDIEGRGKRNGCARFIDV